MATTWLIRNDTLDQELEDQGFVSLGWDDVPDLTTIESDHSDLVELLRQQDPEATPQQLGGWAGTLHRFYSKMQEGDIVVAPHGNGAFLRVGTVTGPYSYVPDAPSHRHRRPVRWGATRVDRDHLPNQVKGGLRNISTLSRVNRGNELFAELARAPHGSGMVAPATEEPQLWLLGANFGGKDHTQDFLRQGIWQEAGGLGSQSKKMLPGDLVAMKATFTQKYELPFDNRGLPVSTMEIRARGRVREVQENRVLVDWDDTFGEPRRWHFYTYMGTVNRASMGRSQTELLRQFIFEDVPQDYDVFLSNPFWARYTEKPDTPDSIEPEEMSVGYRSVRPTAQPVYEAADRWRQAIIEGTSLFTGEPLKYSAATRELVSDYVERPDEGQGTFVEKLRTQLRDSSADAVQLMTELLYVYVLPILPRGMGKEAKQQLLDAVASINSDAKSVSGPLADTLELGIATAGTSYQTYRWRMLQYLVLLADGLAQMSYDGRQQTLTDGPTFRDFLDSLDEQTAWAARLLLEHLLFPNQAIRSASRGDREEMLRAFQQDFPELSSVDDLKRFLEPNVRYGSMLEINPYEGEHFVRWKEPNQALKLWRDWAAAVLDEVGEPDAEEATETRNAIASDNPFDSLSLLRTEAARKITEWAKTNPGAADQLLSKADSLGPALFTDQLGELTGSENEGYDLVEAATTLLNRLDPDVPVFPAKNAPRVARELSRSGQSSGVTPGEKLLALDAAIQVLTRLLFDSEGKSLSPSGAAALVETVIELDPTATTWSPELQAAFLDWRSGRSQAGPSDFENRRSLEKTEDPPTVKPIEDDPTVPKTLEELASSLMFSKDSGLGWLEETRDLLDDKKQMILQGPPGTGKTFFALKLAEFIAKHPDRVATFQFHPGTAYEDFVQGLRPVLNAPGQFHVKPGPLLEMADRAAKEALHDFGCGVLFLG